MLLSRSAVSLPGRAPAVRLLSMCRQHLLLKVQRTLSTSEENREVGERITALSPAWPALCQSPPSSPELHPVRVVHPRCESS
jgi:hypothetical protein